MNQSHKHLQEKYTTYLTSYEGKIFSKTKINSDIEGIWIELSKHVPNLIDKGIIEKKQNTYTIPAFFYSKDEILTLRVIFTVIDLGDKFIIEKISVFKPEEYKETLLQDIETIQYQLPKNMTSIDDTTTPIITQDLLSKEAQRQLKLKELQEKSECFGIPDSFSITKQVECSLFGGKWDKPVKSSQECPFYMKSLSMPMSGGMLKDGGCQMPLGLKRVGYRYYSGEAMCFSDKTNRPVQCSNTTLNDYYFLD